jgi:hypothetical protein
MSMAASDEVPSLVGAFAKDYVEGRLGLRFWLLVRVPTGSMPTHQLCAVFYRAGLLDGERLVRVDDRPVSGHGGGNEVQFPMLVDTVEVVHEGERSPVLSFAWLHGLDEFLNVGGDPLELARPLASEAVGVEADREIEVLRYSLREWSSAACLREFVNEMAQRRPEVVDDIASDDAQVGRGLRGDASAHEVLAGLRIELDVDATVLFEEPLRGAVEAVQVDICPVQLESVGGV